MNFLKKEKLCIGCWEPVTKEDDIYMVAVEIPYLNLFMHKECFKKISDNLLEYVKKNLDKYLKFPTK